MKLGDEILLDERVYILRGVDPSGVGAPRVYLEDVETGELVTDLLARVRVTAADEPTGDSEA